MKKYELLSPVGNFPMLQAAIKAGCDAVYLGLKDFNMRDAARNFSVSDLKKIKKICDIKGVKVYLTLNTIVYDSELKKIEKILKKVKDKVDAVICWDLSVIRLCRKYNVLFHVSTQASVSNVEAARFYKKLGAKRIVLARELNLSQIKKISKVVDVECFCHGAMCVSVSGRCFTSQFLQGMSANRGKCSHPCRREYKVIDQDGYELKLKNNKIMSAKDLCCLPFIDKMKKAGVKSFKIEGRNRSPEYVYVVTGVYRKALDEKLKKQEIKDLIEELKKVYHKGFSTGFYFKVPGLSDFSDSKVGDQKESKQFIGKVENYWGKVGVAHVKLSAGMLKIGDEIYVIGNTTGLVRKKVESMEIKGKKVKQVKKGQEVGIKMDKVRKGDDVYLIKQNIK